MTSLLASHGTTQLPGPQVHIGPSEDFTRRGAGRHRPRHTGPVPTLPSRRLKDDTESDIDHHAETAWPDLDEVTIRWRGSYGYVTAHLETDEKIPLCRLGYLGFDDVWEFAIYDPATDTYQDTLLPSGDNVGTVQEALDCAGRIHLADTTD